MHDESKKIISVPQPLQHGQSANTINVNGIEISWDTAAGTCSFRGIPVALMWVDSTLASLMSGMEYMVGPERFNLALQAEGRKSVESDWLLINSYNDFSEGFAQLNLNAKVAGWGDWQLTSYQPNERECVFRIYNNWESAYQKALGVCWGSGMIAGKLAGICSKQFKTNCWATQTLFVAKGDPYDEFMVAHSRRSLEQEIEELLISDQATRADMAVALKKLQDSEVVNTKIRQQLENIAWLLKPKTFTKGTYSPIYGDITRLNKKRTILDALGTTTIENIVSEFMGMLETSSAVYEINGDYASGIFSSKWCQLMDNASYRLCHTDDVAEALHGGKWLCHESCWQEATKPAIDQCMPNDIACAGGMRLYAVPICVGDTVIGGITFGYNSPPQDPNQLAKLAHKYQISLDQLCDVAHAYQERPQFVIDLAKHRLIEAAKLIGLLVARKQKETELAQAMRATQNYAAEIKAANLELENFTFAASHDLQEPSRIILNYVDALAHDLPADLNQDAREDLHFIHESATRMRHLVQDLAAYTQLRGTRLSWQWVDLTKCLIEVKRQLQLQIAETTARITADGLPTVWGDKTMLTNALRHLVDNAIKFRQQEIAPQVDISAQQIDNIWEIRITDNGIGIDRNHQEMIFSPFKRLNKRMDYNGSGIGLAFVHEVVKRHAGTIRVVESVPHGSIFIISIPIAKIS